MQDDDHILHNMSYNELKERAVEVLSGTEQQNNAKRRLYERRQGLGESLRDYVSSLKTLGTMAYPRADDKQIKNDVLYNLLLLGLRDKTLAEKLIRNNEKVEKPSFHDSARKLVAVTDDHVRKETIAQIQAKEHAHSSKLQNLKSLLFDVQREVSKLREQQNKFYQMPAIRQQLQPVQSARRQYRETRACFTCGKVGHLSRNCYRNRQNTAGANGSHSIESNQQPLQFDEPVTYQLSNISQYSNKCEDDLNHLYLLLIVPLGLQQRVLEAMHDMPHGGGHMGADRTANQLKKRFYWPKWKSDVERHCLTCAICDRRKCSLKLPKAPLVPSNKLRPLQRIEVDVLEGLPTTYDRNRYVLVACDTYKKYMQAWPTISQTAQEIARILYDNWLTVHGVPDRIHTDQGGNFESVLFKELVKLVGSTKSRTTAFHPAGNGGVERNNRTIIAMLKNYVQKNPKSWDRSLSLLCATYNASKHEMIGFSPYFLLTGRELRIHADLLSGCSVVELRHNSVLDLQDRMRLVHEVVKERLNQKRNFMKTRYDKSASLHQYNVGDSVCVVT